MTRMLAVDTSAGRGSVALYLDGDVIAEHNDEARAHTRLLEPMMHRLLARAELGLKAVDALAYGRGPGSFTGLRIAAGFVQGIAWGLDCPVVPVSSLAAMALDGDRTGEPVRVVPALDARMGEVYWSGYDLDGQGGLKGLLDERLSSPEALYLPEYGPDAAWVAVGTGWRYLDRMPQAVTRRLERIDPGFMPHAANVARLAVDPLLRGETVDAPQVQPVYIREDVGWQRHGSR